MLLATAATLSACGNKGPLYLPDTAQQQSDDDASKKRSKKQN
ncbi:MAG: lipoprotein [Acidiferrobacterales bacterium]